MSSAEAFPEADLLLATFAADGHDGQVLQGLSPRSELRLPFFYPEHKVLISVGLTSDPNS